MGEGKSLFELGDPDILELVEEPLFHQESHDYLLLEIAKLPTTASDSDWINPNVAPLSGICQS